MKTKLKIRIALIIVFIGLIGVVVLAKQNLNILEFIENSSQLLLSNNILGEESNNVEDETDENIEVVVIEEEPIVYDGLTKTELVEKINRSLKSTLAGQAESFVNYALELGIDPYLAVAIALHETGCNGKCSKLVNECNNVGGMKGSPGCNGGSYAAFATLDEGIEAYMHNLYNNYISKGLTTADQMASKYAASPTWSAQVNTYINEIKAK